MEQWMASFLRVGFDKESVSCMCCMTQLHLRDLCQGCSPLYASVVLSAAW